MSNHLLEWVTVKNNRYEVPVKLNEQMETEPFLIDPQLGEGHLEFDGAPLSGDYLPGEKQLFTVNVRSILAAKAVIPGLPAEN